MLEPALSGVKADSMRTPNQTPLFREAAPHRRGEADARIVVAFADGTVQAVRVSDPVLKGTAPR
jgi:hypothetical protein